MIELKDINKEINDKQILNDINYSFVKEGFYVITGQSGCGKSTLLNIIGGLDCKHQGSIVIDNKKMNSKERLKIFDYLFQNYGLVESESVHYNLKLVKKANKEKYYDILKIVQLEHVELSQYVHTLSGGEQQRLALARLLLSNRDYILADEPTASLDIHNRDYIINILIELNKSGKTIILVTHDESVIKMLEPLYKVLEIKKSTLLEMKNKRNII